MRCRLFGQLQTTCIAWAIWHQSWKLMNMDRNHLISLPKVLKILQEALLRQLLTQNLSKTKQKSILCDCVSILYFNLKIIKINNHEDLRSKYLLIIPYFYFTYWHLLSSFIVAIYNCFCTISNFCLFSI
jgi:hypothetical protein